MVVAMVVVLESSTRLPSAWIVPVVSTWASAELMITVMAAAPTAWNWEPVACGVVLLGLLGSGLLGSGVLGSGVVLSDVSLGSLALLVAVSKTLVTDLPLSSLDSPSFPPASGWSSPPLAASMPPEILLPPTPAAPLGPASALSISVGTSLVIWAMVNFLVWSDVVAVVEVVTVPETALAVALSVDDAMALTSPPAVMLVEPVTIASASWTATFTAKKPPDSYLAALPLGMEEMACCTSVLVARASTTPSAVMVESWMSMVV